MSTLTRNALGGKLLLLLLSTLLLFLLLMALPPLTPPGNDSTMGASAPAPPPPPEWRWGGKRNYEECPGTAIQHIMCRHGSASKEWGGKFNTNSSIEVRRMVKTAMKKGKLYRTDNGGKVLYTFSRHIGKSMRGKPTKTIEIFLSEAGEILTAYPK